MLENTARKDLGLCHFGASDATRGSPPLTNRRAPRLPVLNSRLGVTCRTRLFCLRATTSDNDLVSWERLHVARTSAKDNDLSETSIQVRPHRHHGQHPRPHGPVWRLISPSRQWQCSASVVRRTPGQKGQHGGRAEGTQRCP